MQKSMDYNFNVLTVHTLKMIFVGYKKKFLVPTNQTHTKPLVIGSICILYWYWKKPQIWTLISTAYLTTKRLGLIGSHIFITCASDGVLSELYILTNIWATLSIGLVKQMLLGSLGSYADSRTLIQTDVCMVSSFKTWIVGLGGRSCHGLITCTEDKFQLTQKSKAEFLIITTVKNVFLFIYSIYFSSNES